MPRQFWLRTDAREEGRGNAEEEADPPRCQHSPAEGQQCWIASAENRIMPYGEILHANSGRYLILHDAVGDGREHTEQDHLQRFHVFDSMRTAQGLPSLGFRS